MLKTMTWTCALAAVVGCSKKDDNPKPAGTPAPAAMPTSKDTPPPTPSGPWQLDAAAVQAKLQGAWSLHNVAFAGSVEAWDVQGNKVRMWDAKQSKESSGTLSVTSPCQLEIKTGSDASGSETTYITYVFEGDTLHLGLGQAGVKQGDTIVACLSDGTYVMKGADCKQYKSEFGHMETKDGAKCALEGDTFKVTAPGDSFVHELKLQNGILLDDQLRNPFSPPKKVASYDEAKAQAK